MSETTNISWCDSTASPWYFCSGCELWTDKVHACYAQRLFKGRLKKLAGQRSKTFERNCLRFNRRPWVCDQSTHGYNFGYSRASLDKYVTKSCGLTFHRRRIFPSLMDWLDPNVPVEWLAWFLDIVRRCDQVTWLLLTKQPQNFFSRIDAARTETAFQPNDLIGWWFKSPPPHIYVGASITDQPTADKRIPELLKIPAAKRFVSFEPALELVDFKAIGVDWKSTAGSHWHTSCLDSRPRIDWLIVGGETGKDARPCNIEWIRSAVRQCKEAGAARFVKQLGSAPEFLNELDGDLVNTQGLSDTKGEDMAEWPKDLRVREFPKDTELEG